MSYSTSNRATTLRFSFASEAAAHAFKTYSAKQPYTQRVQYPLIDNKKQLKEVLITMAKPATNAEQTELETMATNLGGVLVPKL